MCFTYRPSKCPPLCLKVQGSAPDYTLCQYDWHYMACTAVPIFPELAYNSAVVKGSGNKANKRWRRSKKAKDCPALLSEAYTQQLALLLNHLCFRWTQLLGLRGLKGQYHEILYLF